LTQNFDPKKLTQTNWPKIYHTIVTQRTDPPKKRRHYDSATNFDFWPKSLAKFSSVYTVFNNFIVLKLAFYTFFFLNLNKGFGKFYFFCRVILRAWSVNIWISEELKKKRRERDIGSNALTPGVPRFSFFRDFFRPREGNKFVSLSECFRRDWKSARFFDIIFTFIYSVLWNKQAN